MAVSVYRIVLRLVLASSLAIGCGDDPADGELGGACIDLATCDSGLLCLVGSCIRESSQGNGQVCSHDGHCFSGYCDPALLVCQSDTPRPKADLLAQVCRIADLCPEVESTLLELQNCPAVLDASLETGQEQARVDAFVAAGRRTQDCLLECMGMDMCERFTLANVTSVEGMIDADFTVTYDACVPTC